MDKKRNKKNPFEKKKTVFVADAIKSVSSCLWSIILSAWSVQSFIISIVLIMREESKSTKYIKECICAVMPATFFNYETGEAVKIINQKKNLFLVVFPPEEKKRQTRDEKLWWKCPAVKAAPLCIIKKHSNATNDIWRKTIYNNFLSLFFPYLNRREKNCPFSVLFKRSFFLLSHLVHSFFEMIL